MKILRLENGVEVLCFCILLFLILFISFISAQSSVESSSNVVGDIIPPNITITSPENITYGSSLVLINISANDSESDVDSIWYDYGTGNITYTSSVIVNLADGNYILIAYANDTSGNGNSTDVIFVVDTTGDFAGTVRDLATSILIANANVTVLNTNFSIVTPTGIYNLTGIPKGTYTLTASAENYLSQAITNHEIINGSVKVYDFVLAATGRIRGRVLDFFTSSGINNANMTLIQFGNILNSTLTNSSGYYEFSDLAPGYYDISVSATSYTDNSKPNIQVTGNKNTTINLYIW